MKPDVSETAHLIMARPLIYPGLAVHTQMRTLVRFWHEPAFNLSRSWLIHEVESTFYVRRIIWDQHLSYVAERPVTFGSESTVSPSIVTAIMDKLHNVQIQPFVPKNSIGIDGETRGIEFGDYWLSSRLSWLCDPPKGWESLSDWFADALSQLDRLLPEHVDN